MPVYSFVTVLEPDNTQKRIDNLLVTRAAIEYFRQVVVLAGGTDGDEIAPLNANPSGSEYALPVRNIPSGTQAVSGTVALSGVVSVDHITTSVTPGTGAAHLGKAQGGTYVAGDVGVAMLGVRNDSAATVLGTANGTWTPIATDNFGRVWINGAQIDGGAYTGGSNRILLIGASRDDTSPGTAGEDTARALRMSVRRELYAQLRDAAGNERGVNVTADNALSVSRKNALIPEAHDYLALSYTGSNLTGVVAKTGGSGGTTVATLTLAYTGSRLDSVTRT